MVSAQLSLFDMATTESGSFYKPGDWIKIRKVPAIAKHVRVGQTYKIHAIDPTNGQLQFWNPFAGQWDFLCSKEVKLAHVPPDDSPISVEVGVGESIVPDDSPISVEVGVGESIVPDDSPISVEVGVGESIVPDDSPTSVEVGVGESIVPDETNYFLDPISIYTPRGTARGGKYYRLSYKEGGKVRQVHIRGGNTDSAIAQAKVAEVRSLLAAGMSPAQVAEYLRPQN
jgi:hypothetical protein